jgi:alanyl-tRNA synthetase
MTDRLYYHNSFLYDFVAALEDVRTLADGRTALVLDRTAFYPTSGGQTFDTGWIELEPLEQERGKFLPKLRVSEVAEEEDGRVLHVVEGYPHASNTGLHGPPGSLTRVKGFIDVERRRDHMQQHSGQHVLSAAFVELFQMPTVSFHMGEETCTIDLDAKAVTAEQVKKAEARANEIVWADGEVAMRFVTPDEARGLGLRKIPPAERDKLRLIDIKGFDLCACGGTHVARTGQIGTILLRKTEKAKGGVRVEFVCGERAMRTARKDYETLTDAAGLFSTHIWEVPTQIRKGVEEQKVAGKAQQKLLEEIAELKAAQIIAEIAEQDGVKLVARVFEDRELAFVRLLAQKLAKSESVVALLGAGAGQKAVVFAQSQGMRFDMGALMKELMTELGARGGGAKDLAQGGVPEGADLAEVLERVRKRIE